MAELPNAYHFFADQRRYPGLAMGPPEGALMAIEPLTSFDEKGTSS